MRVFEQRDAFGDDAAGSVNRMVTIEERARRHDVHCIVSPADYHLNSDERHRRPTHGKNVSVA